MAKFVIVPVVFTEREYEKLKKKFPPELQPTGRLDSETIRGSMLGMAPRPYRWAQMLKARRDAYERSSIVESDE